MFRSLSISLQSKMVDYAVGTLLNCFVCSRILISLKENVCLSIVATFWDQAQREISVPFYINLHIKTKCDSLLKDIGINGRAHMQNGMTQHPLRSVWKENAIRYEKKMPRFTRLAFCFTMYFSESNVMQMNTFFFLIIFGFSIFWALDVFFLSKSEE